MKKTKFEYVQKRTKRVVVAHDVPVMGVMSDGSEVFSTATALFLDKILDSALALKLPRVELWFVPKVLRATSRASPRKAAQTPKCSRLELLVWLEPSRFAT